MMRAALALARRSLGRTWPNPAVGCLIVRDGVIVAITVNFMQHGTMMAYVTTYDAAFERASPGYILLFDYIRWSIDHGATTIDFLCGDEDYKFRFANQHVTLLSFAGGRTLLGAAAVMSLAPDAKANTAPIADAPVTSPRLRDRLSIPEITPRWSAPMPVMTAVLFAVWNSA